MTRRAIDTAPRDGTVIEAERRNGPPLRVYWNARFQCWSDAACKHQVRALTDLTGWRPVSG